MRTIPNVTLHLKCEDCGHEQDVTSAAAVQHEHGGKQYWFGSAYDFCDVCDGVVKPIPKEKEQA